MTTFTPDLSSRTPDPGLPRDAYALLAQANLLRIRGCWPDAVEKCMEAMRLAPENATAQSLLGDIYENQGRIDDAVQWYRMALDVSPDSPADRVKLERLLHAKTLTSVPTTAALPTASVKASRSTPRWREPDFLLRTASVVAGFLVLAIVTLALLATAQRGRTMPPRQVNAPPVVLPAASEETPPLTSAAAPPPAALRDPAEANLRDLLQNELSGDVRLTDLESDPRTARLTLTLALKPGSPDTLTRAAVLRAAIHAASAAARETDSQAAASFTVRCLLAPADDAGTLSSPLIFVGDLPRADLSTVSADAATLPAESLAALVQNPWWSPLLPR